MADFEGISGLKELQASISKINVALNAQLPSIVESAAEILSEEIRLRAPVKTGALLDSIETVLNHESGHATATVQVNNSDKNGNEHYAIFDEYGTSKSAAKPFFRPAIAAKKDQVEKLLLTSVLTIIETSR